MLQGVKDLIAISRFYGKNKNFVIAGGGNTSFKNDTTLYVKASGGSLETIDESGFAVLDRSMLAGIAIKKYSDNTAKREEQIKNDLLESRIDPKSTKRPSVETSLHDVIDYPFVVHTHPTLVNALTCGNDAEKLTAELFPDAVYIPYTDPGYILFKRVESALFEARSKGFDEPQILILQNHGVFVAADSIDEIRLIYDRIMNKLKTRVGKPLVVEPLPFSPEADAWMAAVAAAQPGKTVKMRNNSLIARFSASPEAYAEASQPFTPDMIVYCKAETLYLEEPGEVAAAVEAYTARYGYTPKIIVARNVGVIGIESDDSSVEIVLDIFEDWLKISLLSHHFGGPHFMTGKQIDFIKNWEAESYRRSLQMPAK